MSSPFLFGRGEGRITKTEIRRRERIAKQREAEFIVTTGNSGHCTCGNGCPPDKCPNKKWWFSAVNRGEPWNTILASTIEAAVREAK